MGHVSFPAKTDMAPDSVNHVQSSKCVERVTATVVSDVNPTLGTTYRQGVAK